MKEKRLLKLAGYLRTVPRERLNMIEWRTRRANAKHGCGFAGCAVGHAVNARLFRGLKLTETGALIYEDYDNWCAVNKLFELDNESSKYLFNRYSYPIDKPPTPKQVAKRIEQFVKDKELSQ